MIRIKIKDLPKNEKIDNEELKGVMGGDFLQPSLYKTIPGSSIILKPTKISAPYNMAYFTLHRSEFE